MGGRWEEFFRARVGQPPKLVKELNTELTRNIILGRDPQRAIDAIAKKMNVSKSTAGRLVMTEQAFFSETAQHDSFRALGVKQYEIVATLDSRTSEICRNMDGKVFTMPQWEVGVTAPPFHVYCRSTTVPAFGDEFDNIGERAARGGEDGKTYYVPADMTYKEWKRSFVDGGKSGLQEVRPDVTIKSMDITNEWTRRKGKKGSVSEKKEYIVNKTRYTVDGKHLILKLSAQERRIAAALAEKYGKAVELVPQVMYPQRIPTPDYLIDGERFDLKSPTGRSKNLFYNMVSKKKEQASSFIFDVTDCPLSEDEIRKQVEALYFSRHTRFIEKIVIMKNGEILKVYGRK